MYPSKKIKVLVVDDSVFFRKFLIDNLLKHENIDVVGYAINAYDAKNKIPILKPDVKLSNVIGATPVINILSITVSVPSFNTSYHFLTLPFFETNVLN